MYRAIATGTFWSIGRPAARSARIWAAEISTAGTSIALIQVLGYAGGLSPPDLCADTHHDGSGSGNDQPGRCITAMFASSSTSCQRCHCGKANAASNPSTRHSVLSGCSALSSARLNTVYDGPNRCSSRVSIIKRGSCASASSSIARRCGALAPGVGRCGG